MQWCHKSGYDGVSCAKARAAKRYLWNRCAKKAVSVFSLFACLCTAVRCVLYSCQAAVAVAALLLRLAGDVCRCIIAQRLLASARPICCFMLAQTLVVLPADGLALCRCRASG